MLRLHPRRGTMMSDETRDQEPARPLRRGLALELHHLEQELAQTGTLCQEMVGRSLEALDRRDLLQAEEVARLDQQVDATTRDVQGRCIALLARQQPLAADLRAVTALLRAVVEIERIADYAVEIAGYASRQRGLTPLPLVPPLVEVGRLVEQMVQATIDAMVERDLNAIARICGPDEDRVDQQSHAAIELATQEMGSHPDRIEQYVHQILAARCLERVADHCTNLAEWVQYAVSGTYQELA